MRDTIEVFKRVGKCARVFFLSQNTKTLTKSFKGRYRTDKEVVFLHITHTLFTEF